MNVSDILKKNPKIKYRARLRIGDKLFQEIEHYLDVDYNELLQVIFRNEELEAITEFNPPRKWNPDVMICSYHVEDLTN